ncbi:glycosyltransferase [Burkholderia vietnamiensis]|jgi:GT2 family glycosyltransferase|uniref:Glycosyltransferase n=2 Tax=Burkholderia cepacia complex TaxID=87882 RepID=A0ABS1AT73_BURVI|nr:MULTISPECIES: glycosyltransferase [Burkholderia cepacia complex]AJY08504.1 glycosyltransferase like 2 family protein [Burkholderia vietnamiensis LMG 10929]AOJ76911.1 glycosyl transferase [Burkholderia ubonensis]AOK02496.1 glycosyl transferase [Burkholderia vietnamiensis]AOK14006.1 glycosyl transferase [Burkholderia vietnamiensis]AOK44938.1 glycosyl transferase [Burkholderia vietnamiensis]
MRQHVRITPARAALAPREPRVTAVVLTYRRADELARTLARLTALRDRPAIVVVDNGSDDATAALVRERFAHVTLVHAPGNVGASGRNLGVAVARTRHVAFCDDDTWWAPGSIAEAANLLDAYPHVAAVTARVLVGAEEREDPTCALMADSPLDASVALPGRPILGLLAGATAFRRDAYLRAGGYHPRYFLGGEEALLALDLYRAGAWLVYAPQLTVHHYPSTQRDARARRSVSTRNDVWTAWLRWPAGAAFAHTVRMLPRLRRECGILPALAGLPWILRERRAIPPHVERMRRRLDDAARQRARA